PDYADFLANVPDVSLRNAEEGYIFRVFNGFGSGNFGWLLWNIGRPSSASVLADSLTWPGDSTDYTNHGDIQIAPATPHYTHIVRGYVEPTDATDIAMHIGDWVAANAGSVNAATVRDALASHIDLAAEGRTLRLLIWDESDVAGNNGRYRISGFGLFQLHGYSMSQSGGGSWLLLEFIGWDTSCGQPSVAPESVAINGPANGSVNASYTFMATVSPVETGLPLTYIWEATGQTAVTHTVSSRTDIISFTWPVTGTQTVTVTASKGTAVVSDTHTITINPLPAPADLVIGPLELVTPQPVRPYDPVQFRTTISNTGDIDITNQFLVDIYLDPAEVYRDS
ncbi:MAG: hypothetical protein GY803_02780, partial [Chloroflexi bacterium]|nr:hypothetical protein [Chloroflexota bacterium]